MFLADIWGFFLACVLKYEAEINTFVGLNKDLRDFELSDDEWTAIHLVTGWLAKFHDTTTQMSKTKSLMLSHTHAIFRGLQEHIHKALSELSSSVNPRIKAGLLAAHAKLSEYYYRFDDGSPFYIWAVSQ